MEKLLEVSQVADSVELKEDEIAKSQEEELIEVLPKKLAKPLKMAGKSSGKWI